MSNTCYLVPGYAKLTIIHHSKTVKCIFVGYIQCSHYQNMHKHTWIQNNPNYAVDSTLGKYTRLNRIPDVSLERVAGGIGLHVNVNNMEYMCFNQVVVLWN